MVSLTDHQWDAVKKTVAWYNDAANFYAPTEFLMKEVTDEDGYRMEKDYPFYGNGSGLSKGQDFFFGGFAGTGKTTVVPPLIEEMGLDISEVAFVCPTGKAAKVLSGKLMDFGMRTAATTIHKLIYIPSSEEADFVQQEIDRLNLEIDIAQNEGKVELMMPVGDYDKSGELVSLEEALKIQFSLYMKLDSLMTNSDGPRFKRREQQDFPEDVKLLVVDEGSMVGATLAEDLAAFGRPILAFGDPGQLPPVGDEYGFNCEQPDAFLTEIHRQAADNPIIELATMVRQGKHLPLCNFGDVKVVERRNDDVTLNMDRDAMILCGTHKKRWTLTKKIRTELGITETGPVTDEPLLVCKNSQTRPGLVNGSLVTCNTEHGNLTPGESSFRLNITDEYGAAHDVLAAQPIFEEMHLRKRNGYTSKPDAAFKAKKDCENLDFGYVLTVHKSQGSQWDDVVVHDESAVFRDAASRWLYTGITRSSDKLTVVV